MSNEKVTYERDGIRRQFSKANIEKHSNEEVKYPENFGWKKVPQEVLDAESKPSTADKAAADKAAADKAAADKAAADKAAADKAAADKAAEAEAGTEKTSKDFKTSDVDIHAIKELLAGKTPEEITAFFEGETRVTLNNLKDSLLS